QRIADRLADTEGADAAVADGDVGVAADVAGDLEGAERAGGRAGGALQVDGAAREVAGQDAAAGDVGAAQRLGIDGAALPLGGRDGRDGAGGCGGRGRQIQALNSPAGGNRPDVAVRDVDRIALEVAGGRHAANCRAGGSRRDRVGNHFAGI